MTSSDPPAKADGDDVLSSLPRARPQRRSSKRDDVRSTAAKPSRARSAASTSTRRSPGRKPATPRSTAPRAGKPRSSQPAGVRPSAATTNARGTTEPRRRDAMPPTGIELVGTAVAAAGELAQLGVSLGARALRHVATRVPRP